MTNYDDNFFDTINQGSINSARVVVPLVLSYFEDTQTVIDVGCGEGAWLSVFKEHECDVWGVDGDYVDENRLLIEPNEFTRNNLENPLDLGSKLGANARFDLAVSLEVAEHLDPSRADSFVDDLCSLSNTVLFSAAIPGQGGTHHVNEQWPAYWEEKFARNGYRMSGALRWLIWNNDNVENWYRQNLMVCAKNPLEELDEFFNGPVSVPFPVVHPVLWNHIRG